ncbi:MAG: oligoendopeptidase F [candidate division Zixibacteria bacterium]|nr:oligoendopeptidase F [candidate division Zixibacteria bacterium]
MSKDTKQAAKAIPQRTDVADQHKWKLTDIYADDAAWESDYEKVQAMMKKAADYTGKLDSSAELLYECLETRSQLVATCFNLYQYAHLNRDLDNRVSKFQAMNDRAAMLSSEAQAAFAFVEPELLTMEDAKLRALAGRFPKTDTYDFYIEELIRSRKHIRSGEVEELLAQSAMVARAPGTIFGMLNDADIKYPSIKDEDGEEVPLTKQRYAKFMESSDRRVRREAHGAFYGVYKDHLNTTGSSLASSVNADIFYARARGYKSCLHHALDAFNIPLEVYHSLLDTTEANLTGLHKWITLRKKLLKLDEIYTYDMFHPLVPDLNIEIPWEEAVEKTFEAVKPLGEKYCSDLKVAFENRWVDVWETEGKSSGAFSWGNYSAHPFVMMNYNGTIDNMFTLAHEMGHALHSHLSNTHQPYPKHQYSTFVAEVASTLNEGLVMQLLLKTATDPKQKLFLLNRHIDNTLGTFMHQVMYARFELAIHELVEKGEALSPDLLTDLFEELIKRYYGPSLATDDWSKLKWSRIPHFYTAFYVYQYATSYAASQAILDKFISGEDGIVEKYLELISSGGSDHPINQLKKCGIDMTTPTPFEATIRLFAEQVDEVERLAMG